MILFITYSGWIVSLLSLVVTFILYKKGRILKRLQLYTETVSSLVVPLKETPYILKLNDIEVGAQLNRTVCILKNKGNTGIEKSDAKSTAEIVVETKDGKIINAYVGKTESEDHVSTLKIIPKEDRLSLQWDYIDAKEKNHIVIYTSGEFKKAYLKGQFRSGIIVENRSADQDTGRVAIPILFIGSLISGSASSAVSFRLIGSNNNYHLLGIDLTNLGWAGYDMILSFLSATFVTIAFAIAITLLVFGARYIPKALKPLRVNKS